ncbi:hypothetical protein GGR08_000662 [Bartonella fuyuanensis]|uniref:Uncharacterized protein n=1 Tax=Bartonella fuyuanensis TaxID=1460968 RepID=A0A840DXW5_9HYPH|nr:hypothetical protein [Bartonella fuyuanensis]MBB4076365.1 hypothetical protein [Bartonella fuyuanensis]
MKRIREKLLDRTILNLSWEGVVDFFDVLYNLFYLDLPYFAKKQYYSSGNFVEADFISMAKVLKDI